ncbi:putative bifunctional diguanylate cyclase/phosphodiesterase [Sphingobium algorifonticola]|uniref:EAL domain-containing protein n=1 Tax=Sphingobium algorifonticola TaxID=2008318 RepID=A0A437JBS5_9SPHN|nr:EAL domain-containing protein [Sphingobium algorifonticola]RVT43082.1 EAL domain-containing protein [Sphingobium algorifonticola]
MQGNVDRKAPPPPTGDGGPRLSAQDKAQRDLLTGAILFAASILFVVNGSTAMGQVIDALSGLGAGVEEVLTIAVLLNVALILFGYRRYRDLQQEVAHRAAAEERARSLAAIDPLTDFYNRRSLLEQGAAMIADAHGRGRAVAVLLLDLDHFKTVNDIHGHEAGDHVLKVVAERIARVMPPHALAARLGGDEFACTCIFDPAHPETVERVAEDVVAALSHGVAYGSSELIVSTSLGLSRSDCDGDQIDVLIRRADIAMYSAKNAGRNRHAWFAFAMEEELHRRSVIEAAMRRGIAQGEFVPYYEPQMDLLSGELLGFEMLARWESPELGLTGPDQFIHVAEETGMIGELSFAVMRRAFSDARNWDPALTLSVNISPSQLRDPWLSQKLLKLLLETGYPANRLEVEITETCLFENLELAKTIVQSLKNQGIRIALDDFGTGYSSLAHLRALPFDRIKIDRSFVTAMGDNGENAAIVTAIARLGESLGLPVTAEGVETLAIETQLRGIGLAKGQGWHFGKPMTIEQTRRMLADRGMLPARERTVAPTDNGVPPRQTLSFG